MAAGVRGAPYLWLRQLQTMLWLHYVQRARRKLHTAAEILSPSLVFLVLVYGVFATPTMSIPAFQLTATTAVINITARESASSSSGAPAATIAFTSIVRDESLNIANVSLPDRYLDTVLLPYVVQGSGSSVASAIATMIVEGIATGTPVIVPPLDEYAAALEAAAQILGRRGEKRLQYYSAAAWLALNHGKLAFAPDTADVRQLMAYLTVTSASFATLAIPEPYSSAMVALDDNPTPGTLLAVIEFTEFDVASAQVGYTIHMNETFVPDSATVISPFPQGFSTDFVKYLTGGFATLEFEINDYFARLVAARNGAVGVANSGVSAVESICNNLLASVIGNASDQLFAPTDSLPNIAINQGVLDEPPVPVVVPTTINAAAVATPCAFEMAANCSTSSATPATMLLCLRNLLASASAVCAALLAAIDSSDAPCLDVLTALGFTSAAEAIGTNASMFPGAAGLLNASMWSLSCSESTWAGFVNSSNAASDPCASDLAAYCPSDLSDDSERFSCLSKNVTQLTPLCRSVVLSINPATGNACADDLATVCPYNGLTSAFPLFCIAVQQPVLSLTCLESPLYAEAALFTARSASILNVSAAATVCATSSNVAKMFTRNVAVAAFPAPGYEQSQFYASVGTMFGLVAALSFLFPFTSLMRHVVQDRELQHKTLLLAVGVRRISVIFLAHVITGALLSLVCGFFAVITFYSIMPYISVIDIYGLLVLYYWSLACLSLLASRLCKSTRTSSTLAPLLLLAASMPAFVVAGQQSMWDFVLSPCVIVSTFNDVALVAQSSVPMSSTGGSIHAAQIVLVAQSVAYLAVALMLEVAAASFRHGIFAHLKQRVRRLVRWFVEGPEHPDVSQPANELDEELRALPIHSQRSLAVNDSIDSSGTPSPIHHVALPTAIECIALSLKGHSGGTLLRDRLMNVTCALPIDRVTALIGPTGSGKSSLLGLFNGIEAADSGTVAVFGKDIDAVSRHCIGSCLQESVVWDALTVREHLALLKSFKGESTSGDMDAVIDGELAELDLLWCQNTRVNKVPSSIVRRMSVAMAFAGGRDTTLVLLDSVTDGVDLDGVARITDFIDRRKQGKCVVVATSHFAEAEGADQVILMDRGVLLKIGTPLELRGPPQYGIAFRSDGTVPPDSITSRMSRLLPSSVLLPDADSLGTGEEWLSFTVAADDDDGGHAPAAIRRIRAEVPGITHVTVCMMGLEHALTQYLRTRWEALAQAALADAEHHGGRLSHIGTDEVVETAVGEMGVSLLEHAAAADAPSPKSRKSRMDALREMRLAEEHAVSPDDVDVACDVGTDVERAQRQKGWRQHCRMIATVMTKRLAEALSDASSNLVLYFAFPLICLALALRLLSIPDPAPVALSLDPVQLFGAGQELCWGVGEPCPGPSLDAVSGIDFVNVGCNLSNSAFSDFLYQTEYSHAAPRYGAVLLSAALARVVNTSAAPGTAVFSWRADTVFHNTSSPHALPSYLSFMQAARLHATLTPTTPLAPQFTPTTQPYPSGVPLLTAQKIVRNLVSTMLLLLPFAFFPSVYVADVVQERRSGFLNIMLASGLAPWHYWCGTFLWNVFGFTIFSIASLFIMIFFGAGLVSSADAPVVLLLMILYGACATVLGYVLSLLFKKANTAQNAMMMVSLISGFVFVLSWASLELVVDSPTTQAAKERNRQLGAFLRVLPPFALGQGLVRLALLPMLRVTDPAVTVISLVSESMQLMGLFPVYFGLLLIGEVLHRCRRCRRWTNGGHVTDASARTGSWNVDCVTVDVDASTCALHHVTATLPGRATVALIGPNGSGKSTLKAVMAGEVLPTCGECTFDGGCDAYFDVGLLRSDLGVSPSDGGTLPASLTPHSLLHVMADLRGLRVSHGSAVHVLRLLRDVGVYAVRHKKLRHLSEPTRRRVGIVMAMVGFPRRVVLDGALSGLDPAARACVLGLIRETRGRASIVLTAQTTQTGLRCDQVVLLRRGAVVWAGGPDEEAPHRMTCLQLTMRPLRTWTEAERVGVATAAERAVASALPVAVVRQQQRGHCANSTSVSYEKRFVLPASTPADEVLEAMHRVRRELGAVAEVSFTTWPPASQIEPSEEGLDADGH